MVKYIEILEEVKTTCRNSFTYKQYEHLFTGFNYPVVQHKLYTSLWHREASPRAPTQKRVTSSTLNEVTNNLGRCKIQTYYSYACQVPRNQGNITSSCVRIVTKERRHAHTRVRTKIYYNGPTAFEFDISKDIHPCAN